ncbi:MAG TPA: hypothetical protein VG982_00140 [Candidatus Paceibacterota bacterium]|jgi:hypothetical protein|nr:hypothetical protein [Candidatus Paceibacterota bacterium]
MFSSVAYAASIDQFLGNLNAKVINPAIEFAFIVAFVIFLFGIMEFLRGAANEEKRTKGKQHMMWGIVGFLIMFGVWGIINILLGTFGIKGASINQQEQKFNPPCIQNLKVGGDNVGSIVPCGTTTP